MQTFFNNVVEVVLFFYPHQGIRLKWKIGFLINMDNGGKNPMELELIIFKNFNVYNAFLISVVGSYLTQPKAANLATSWEWEKVDEIKVSSLMTSNHPPIHP